MTGERGPHMYEYWGTSFRWHSSTVRGASFSAYGTDVQCRCLPTLNWREAFSFLPPSPHSQIVLIREPRREGTSISNVERYVELLADLILDVKKSSLPLHDVRRLPQRRVQSTELEKGDDRAFCPANVRRKRMTSYTVHSVPSLGAYPETRLVSNKVLKVGWIECLYSVQLCLLMPSCIQKG